MNTKFFTLFLLFTIIISPLDFSYRDRHSPQSGISDLLSPAPVSEFPFTESRTTQTTSFNEIISPLGDRPSGGPTSLAFEAPPITEWQETETVAVDYQARNVTNKNIEVLEAISNIGFRWDAVKDAPYDFGGSTVGSTGVFTYSDAGVSSEMHKYSLNGEEITQDFGQTSGNSGGEPDLEYDHVNDRLIRAYWPSNGPDLYYVEYDTNLGNGVPGRSGALDLAMCGTSGSAAKKWETRWTIDADAIYILGQCDDITPNTADVTFIKSYDRATRTLIDTYYTENALNATFSDIALVGSHLIVTGDGFPAGSNTVMQWAVGNTTVEIIDTGAYEYTSGIAYNNGLFVGYDDNGGVPLLNIYPLINDDITNIPNMEVFNSSVWYNAQAELDLYYPYLTVTFEVGPVEATHDTIYVFTIAPQDESSNILINNQYNIAEDDGLYGVIFSDFGTADLYNFNQSIQFTLYDLTIPAIVGADYRMRITNASGTYDLIDEVSTINLNINSRYSASELRILLTLSYSSGIGLTGRLGIFDTGVNTFKWNETTVAIPSGAITKIETWVDYVWAESNELNSHIRSDTKYTSAYQKSHRLQIDVPDYSIPLAIYAPTNWNFSSITPQASVAWDNTAKYWLVQGTIPTIYEMVFISGAGFGMPQETKNEMALKDVSAVYAQTTPQIGFEGGTQDGWVTNNGYASELNTTLSSEGQISLRLEDTDAGVDELQFQLWSSGLIWYSFDYFIDTWDGSLFNFSYWEVSEGWTDVPLNMTIKNRWQTHFGVMRITGNDAAVNIQFEKSAGASTGVILIDNIQFQIPAIDVVNTGIDKHQVSTSLISWDGKRNPATATASINIQLIDPAKNLLINEWTTTTDASGQAQVIYEGQLNELNYRVLVYGYNNYTRDNTTVHNNYTPLRASHTDAGLSHYDFDTRDWYERNATGTESPDLLNSTTITMTNAVPGDIWYTGCQSTLCSGISPSNTSYSITARMKLVAGTDQYFGIAFFDGPTAIDGLAATSNYMVVRANTPQSIFKIDDVITTPIIITYSDVWYIFRVDVFQDQINFYIDNELKTSRINVNGLENPYFGVLGQNSTATIDYLRLSYINELEIHLTETETIVTSTNNTLTYAVYSDNSFIGEYSDSDLIPLNTTAYANHNLTIIPVRNSMEADKLFVPDYTNKIEHLYDNSIGFSISVNSFGVTDSLISTFITATRDGNYTAYENDTSVGSGNFLSTGTSIQTARNTTTGYIFLYAILFQNETNQIWFNTSYSNALVDAFTVSVQSFTVSEVIISTYITSNRDGTYTVYENNTSADSGSFAGVGTSIQTNRNLTAATLFYYSVKFEQAVNIIWFNTTYSNAPEEINQLLVASYSIDADAGLFYTTIETAWANNTVQVYDNNAALGNPVSEGTSVWSFTISPGTHNFSTVVRNGVSIFRYLNVSITIVESAITSGDMYIRLQNGVGQNVPFETFSTYYRFNGTTEYIPMGENVLFFSNIGFDANIYMNDSFGQEMANVTVSYNQFLFITVSTYEILFTNGVNQSLLVQLKLPAQAWSEAVGYWVGEDAFRTVRLFTGTYDVRVLADDGIAVLQSFTLTATSDQVINLKEGVDLILYGYTWNSENGNVTISLVTNYGDSRVEVWDNSNLIGTFNENGSISWAVATGVNASQVVFYVAHNVTKYGGTEEQQILRAFSYAISLDDFEILTSDVSWIETNDQFNITVVSNQLYSVVRIWHDGIINETGSLANVFVIDKDTTTAGNHNITLLVNWINGTGYQFNNWFILSYWTASYYTVSIDVIPSAPGLKIKTNEIDVASFNVYIDGVLVNKEVPDPFKEQTTEQINTTLVADGTLWIRNTAWNHTLTINDKWDVLVYETLIDLRDFTYRVYELPLAKIALRTETTQSIVLELYYWNQSTVDSYTLGPELYLSPGVEGQTAWIVSGVYSALMYDVETRSTVILDKKVTKRITVENTGLDLDAQDILIGEGEFELAVTETKEGSYLVKFEPSAAIGLDDIDIPSETEIAEKIVTWLGDNYYYVAGGVLLAVAVWYALKTGTERLAALDGEKMSKSIQKKLKRKKPSKVKPKNGKIKPRSTIKPESKPKPKPEKEKSKPLWAGFSNKDKNGK